MIQHIYRIKAKSSRAGSGMQSAGVKRSPTLKGKLKRPTIHRCLGRGI
jgi:hypothetical protein